MIRFLGRATVIQATLPYRKLDAFPDFPSYNPIDQLLAAKWKEMGLTPSPQCSDEEFLRRLMLDAIGTLPTPKEVREFLADTSPDKRDICIERVLARPETVRSCSSGSEKRKWDEDRQRVISPRPLAQSIRASSGSLNWLLDRVGVGFLRRLARLFVRGRG